MADDPKPTNSNPPPPPPPPPVAQPNPSAQNIIRESEEG